MAPQSWSSSSEMDELEGIPPGTYCVWRPGSVPPSPVRCKKSSSTGSSFRWRIRDLVRRSRSDGKEKFVFLAAEEKIPSQVSEKKSEAAAAEAEGEKKQKGEARSRGKKGSKVTEVDLVTAHRIYYGSTAGAAFLLMLAVVPAAVCTAAMLFLREYPAGAGDDDTETKYFGAINAMAVVIAVYLLVFDLTGEHGVTMSRAFVAVLLVLLATPAAVPIYAAFKARSENLDLEEGPIKEPLLIEGVREEQQPPAAAMAAEEYRKRGPAIGEDHTILEAAKTAD